MCLFLLDLLYFEGWYLFVFFVCLLFVFDLFFGCYFFRLFVLYTFLFCIVLFVFFLVCCLYIYLLIFAF